MTGTAILRESIWSRGRRAWCWWIGTLRSCLPQRFRGERRRRIDASITLERDRWLIRDRRGVLSTIDPRDGTAVTHALDALKGRRKQTRVAVAVPLSRCFVRRTEVPRTMLGHVDSILQSDLELATPFQGGSVHWDWFVDGKGAATEHLDITQIVLKRRDTESLTEQLMQVGVAVTRISVVDDAVLDRPALPVDLLRHDSGHQGDGAKLRRSRRVLTAAAVLAALAVVPAAFSRQSAALAAVDGELEEARDVVALRPGLPRATLEALGNALAARRSRPPIDAVLDRLAATLPSGCTLDRLFLDSDVLTIQGTAAAPLLVERALAASTLFSVGHNTATPSQGLDAAPFTIRLKLRPIVSQAEA